MNLSRMARQRASEGKPVRVGLIGAGKFGSMFLAQVPTAPGLIVTAIADLSVERARTAMTRVGWDTARADAVSLTEDGAALAHRDDVDVVVEATGHPAAGIAHARAAFSAGKHVVMVTVEADALVGPLLAAEAASAGVVYSMAYGDQPALVAEMVDWARTCGFAVVAAGKGTRYLPGFHQSTPDTVWSHMGYDPEAAIADGLNPQMFNSFIDGTKSAIEMAAIANASELDAPADGLAFPPCGVDDLPRLFRPRGEGGLLAASGQVEVVACEERDSRPVFRDLRWGVYVVVKAPTPYAARCFGQYGVVTDPSGLYAALYRPVHLIGMELNVSILSAALRGEPTGSARAFRADVVATAKRDLAAGDRLDGEGGYTVYGRLMPAAASLASEALPLGLAHGVTLTRAVAAGETVRRSDVTLETHDIAVTARAALEAASNT